MGKWVLGILLLVLVLLRCTAPPLREGYSFSKIIFDSHGKLLRLTTSNDEKFRLWVPLSRISEQLVEATLLHEDQYFFYHPGFNPYSILRSVWETYVKKGRRLGASTLTMQLVRIREKMDTRTVGGKLSQIGQAIALELRYSKDAILEAYLNLVPYGGNIEGVEAASQILFSQSAKDLDLIPALTLSVIPQSPAARSPLNRDVRDLLEARRFAFDQWLGDHPEDKDKRSALDLPFRVRSPAELPFLAPHFVDGVLLDHPHYHRLVTTLDSGFQALLERQVSAYVGQHRLEGIENAAAMVVHVGSREIRALVGSADFFDSKISGQVDGTRARRSPGSTLKPFIYGLGIQKGIIHPHTMMKDAPTAYGIFHPENFDGEFAGPISAVDALVRSRNIPAIWLANELGKNVFYDWLKTAGISHMRSPEHYGLSLVFGGAETTMRELSMLYAGLASGGEFGPLKSTPSSVSPTRRLLSVPSAFVVKEMLETNDRPEEGFRRDWVKHDYSVAWKTGTSFGFRDAWSIGIVGPYVVAVWVGNFSGEGNPKFVGRRAAGPLLFHVIEALHAKEGGFVPHRLSRRGVKKVAVCALSGALPGEYCHHTVQTSFIPGVSPITKCEIHRAIEVAEDSNLRACPELKVKKRTEVYEVWPSDLLQLFAAAGIPRRQPPAYDPRCALDSISSRGVAPKITSPREHVQYTILEDGKRRTIPFSAIGDGDVREFFWFVDETFVGKSTASGTLFWEASPGDYLIRVVDDQGRSGHRELQVVLPPAHWQQEEEVVSQYFPGGVSP